MIDRGNRIDAIRHVKVFDPAVFGGARIDCIGCGATGSRIAMSLAKLGVQNLHLWDFDKVESHNIANQVFGIPDIGAPKVAALGAAIKAQTGLQAVLHDERVTGQTQLGRVVFLLTDTMASRKEIWTGAIKYNPNVDVCIETRMGANEGRVYTVVPSQPSQAETWEATLCSDETAQVSLCGSQTTVGPTAEAVSALAVWQFIKWFRNFSGDETVPAPESEVIFHLGSIMTMTRHFDAQVATASP